MALQIRRGLLGELNTITPAEGEPVYTTDAKKVYIGDGVTQGGILVSAGQDVTTTSNVTFASVIVTNTATVGAIKFPDGSVQTTADTANPDQSVNTTSNVRFASVTVDAGGLITTSTLTVKEITSNKNIIAASTTSFKIYLDNTEAFLYRDNRFTNPADPGYVFELGNGSNGVAVQVKGDRLLDLGSHNQIGIQIQQGNNDNARTWIRKPDSFGLDVPLVQFTGTEVLVNSQLNPYTDNSFALGSSAKKWSNILTKAIEIDNNVTIGAILYRDKYDTVSISTSTANTSTFLVAQWDNSIRSTQKFTLQAIDINSSPDKIHFQEISIVDDGTNQYKVEYGINTNAGVLGSYTVNASGTTGYLLFTPNALATASPNAFKIMGEQLQIRNA